MATTKSRREIFEEQLRDLQKDISNLSSKLSIPPTVSSTRVGTTAFSADSRIDSSSISIAKDPSSSFLSAAEASNPVPASEKESYFRQQLEVLTGDLTKAYKERDEAKRQVEQLTQENEELRKGLPEYARLKAMYESLKQDHEALKTSLDSSERIRFQQKELIQVLQRSNNMGVDSSAASVQSISSISQKGDVSSMHSLAALIGSQPTNSVLSGYQGHGGDTPQWVYTSPAQNYASYAIAANQGTSQGNGNATAMKIRRSAEKTNVSTRKSRVVVPNNPLTRKKSTPSGKGGDSDKKKKTKKNTTKLSASSSAYQRITQDVLNDSRPSSFQDILSQNQSLLSAANLQQLQNFHNLNASPTPFLQQMMLNQSVADQSAALLETIQAQQRQPVSLMQPESYGLPQNPEVSAARASVAATLTSAGKPPRYPGAPSLSPAVTGTVVQNQPITIPTAPTRYDVSASYVNKTPALDRSHLSSGGVSKGSATARSPSPMVVMPRTAKSAPSPSSPVARPAQSSATGKSSSGKGTKAKRKSSVETAGPTKVLYRPLPSPVSTFGTSRRL